MQQRETPLNTLLDILDTHQLPARQERVEALDPGSLGPAMD